MAALLGLAVLIVLSSPARLALAIFQARWARGALVEGAGGFLLWLSVRKDAACPNRGTIVHWKNDSGHYQSSETMACYAKLPLGLFLKY